MAERSPDLLAQELQELREIVTTTTGRVADLERKFQELTGGLNAAVPAPGSDGQRSTAAAQAVKAVASRVAKLEEQLDSDIAPECTTDEVPAVRLARLEGRVETLAEEADALREQRRMDAINTVLTEHAGSSPDGLAEFDSKIHEVADDLQGLRRVVEQKLFSEEDTITELDRRSESRLASVWKELRGLAESAAIHTNNIERNLSLRIEKIEKGSVGAGASTSTDCRFTENMSKQLESLAFRLSWIEWGTSGEKRSFGRPLLQPSSTNKTGFPQIPSDDSEMLAREPSGQMRPRRKMQLPKALQPTQEHVRHQSLKTRSCGSLRHPNPHTFQEDLQSRSVSSIVF